MKKNSTKIRKAVIPAAGSRLRSGSPRGLHPRSRNLALAGELI